MNNLLVLGGTGFLGHTLCETLVERSGGGTGRITVTSRHPQRYKELLVLPSVDVVGADVHDPDQLVRLMAGHDAVINLVAILHGSEADFHQVHVELPRKLAQACTTAGVRRLVHVSALGAAADGPSHYQRSKAEGEAVLRNAGLDLTVLRPSVMFGTEDHFMNLFAGVQAFFPVMPLAAADAQFQPVWVGDVAQAIANSLDRHDTVGQTFECAGPSVYTLAELVRLAGRWSEHERPVIPLPDGVARLQALLMEWLPGQPLISRDNLDAMQVPNVATGAHPGLDALGIQPRALELVMPEWLAHGGAAAHIDDRRRTANR